MNKKEFIKKQTKKNFVQQKVLEVLIIPASLLIIYLFGYLMRYIDILIGGNPVFTLMDTFWKQIVYGIMGLLYFVVLSLAMFYVGYRIYKIFKGIIEINWEWAEERAKKKYNDVKGEKNE